VASIACLLTPTGSGLAGPGPGFAASAAIRLNSVGFPPDAVKRATIAVPCGEFRVVRADSGAVVFTGQAGAPIATAATDTGETVQVADFSGFNAPGRYQLDVPGIGRSAPFTIAADVWNAPFYLVTRAMYLWRCGTAVRAEWNGVTYEHGPCHLEDGWFDYAGGGHVRKPGTGGWHDAGDYNKYVVNAAFSVGLLFQALEQFPDRVAGVKLDLPESGNGVPDLLNEIRWELEWLLTMQQDDGQVYHKLSALNFHYWGPPDQDTSPRYYCPWSTTATADFVAVFAAAARHFRRYDAAFADRCLAAALKSWARLADHPEDVPADQQQFQTGKYAVTDASHRLWAAAELWETTGEPRRLRDFEHRAAGVDFVMLGPTWGDATNLALGTYLLSHHPARRNSALVARLQASLFAQAGRMVATADSNGYGRPLGGERSTWFWGCNGSVAAQTYLLHVADRLRPDPRYRQAALDALAYLFGRNYHGRSYVTGLGADPPQHPHDRRGEPAWPGCLVGGGWPDGKSWLDLRQDARLNEIAINWNAALIYAVAAFVEPPAPSR
jgi:endoglucanase